MVKNKTKLPRETTHERAASTGYEGKILEYIKQNGSVSLAELEKLGIKRQTLRYNLRKMCREKLIRPFIKMKPNVGFVFPEDDEIYFTYTNSYEYPQDVLKLINEMCGNDIPLASQAHNEFISLCVEKGGKEEFEKFLKECKDKNMIPTAPNFGVEPAKIESVRRLAIQLMSNLVPGLKEKIAFALTSDHIQYRLQLLNSFI